MSADQIWGRLKLAVAQAKTTLIGAKKVQVEALSDEPLENIKRVEPYGFSYRPHPGSQAYLVFPAGDRSFGIALVIGDEQYQLELQDGEVAVHDDEGNYMWLKRGGIIEVKASTKVLATTPLFETTGDAKIGGNLVVAGMTSSAGGYQGANGSAAKMTSGAAITGPFTVNGKNVGDSHTHPVSGSHTLGVD